MSDHFDHRLKRSQPMSDHFDHRLKRTLKSDADRIECGASNVRRIELITGTGRRRRWSSDDKARIVEESLKPGANVSEVARRNGLSPQQLFAWRRAAHALFQDGVGETPANRTDDVPTPEQRRTDRQVRLPGRGEATSAFAPVVIAAASPSSPPPRTASGTVEIAVGDTVVRVIGQVETSVLIAVLRAVRRAS
jgi:transposase